MRNKPRNELEKAILAVAKKSTAATVHALLRQYWDSPISIPSRTPVYADFRELTPALVEYQGMTVLYAFSDPDRATPFALEHGTTFMAIVTGQRLAQIKAPAVGVLLNPGDEEFGQFLHPEALVLAAKTFGAQPA